MKRTLLALLAILPVAAQAPVLQDGALALRRARLDWVAGDPPQAPPGLPSLEVGLGGAEAGGSATPLVDGEGLGGATLGWGLGLQGRYVSGPWSGSATLLGLRDHARTQGTLHRAALVFQGDSGWRVALEQTPLAWGSGLLGGDLLGSTGRNFPRLSLRTRDFLLPLGQWHLEAFGGRLEPNRQAPEGSSRIGGALLRATFSPDLEVSLGALTQDARRATQGNPPPEPSSQTTALAELRLHLPSLARLAQARGAALTLGRTGLPGAAALVLSPGRTLLGLQLVWEGWDLGLEAASAAPWAYLPLSLPGDRAGSLALEAGPGPAFGLRTRTRTLDLGFPLFLEGQGRLRLAQLRTDAGGAPPSRDWQLQVEGQWRTATGRVGASLASRRTLAPMTGWDWSCSLFQAFRVF